MDRSTRNAIEKATQRARRLLEDDFTSQLEGTYDVLRSGAVPQQGGPHLSAKERLLREKIVASVEHKRAAGMKAADAVADYIRDAAFTTLNRFVALKMLEARELVQECITKGEQSAGYREFCGLAPGVALLPDGVGYRLYIESLFDELSTEVKVLFDRRDPASVLWPKRGTFESLLEVLNHVELREVWGEDETIGWVYQYFNSGEERRGMRESHAPRNSRELAVRNQFFTPRYVVQFLTENTLGRLWGEMREGDTVLREQCRYMARLPGGRGKNLPKKDPRELRILDPACGSGHFLLYAFDLLIVIYAESWSDAKAPILEATGRTLRADYPSIDELHRAIPGLILKNNLHGIDIDPRCAQVAALALWMRAHRSFSDFGIARAERPAIMRTNIVLAEPMPGEKDLRHEFVSSLDKKLGLLVEQVFERMRLAGEAGSLLRIEAEIEEAIRDVYRETGALFREIDEETWREAEEKLLLALELYAERADGGHHFRRRLFAEDATRGLAFIEICRQRYDVILMNPPFGRASENSKDWLYRTLPIAAQDLLAAFIERFSFMLSPNGVLGAITGRLALFKTLLEPWRENFFLGKVCQLSALADLGYGVLDSAVVETAAYVLSRAHGAEGVFFRADVTQDRDKEEALRRKIDENVLLSIASFQRIPGKPIAHNSPEAVLKAFETLPSLEDCGFRASSGAETGDNFRFLRCFWEVPLGTIAPLSRWTFAAKGGEYNPWLSDVHLVLDYSLIALARRAADVDLYGKPCITWTGRTTSNASFRVLPAGCVPTRMGQMIWRAEFPEGAFGVLAYLNSTPALAALEVSVGGGDASVAGTGARHFLVAHVRAMPCIHHQQLEQLSRELYRLLSEEAHNELSPRFVGPFLPATPTLQDACESACIQREKRIAQAWEAWSDIEHNVRHAIGWDDATWNKIANDVGHVPLAPPMHTDFLASPSRASNKLTFAVHPCLEKHLREGGTPANWRLDRSAFRASYAFSLLSWLVGCSLGRWDPMRLEHEWIDESEPFSCLPSRQPGLKRASSQSVVNTGIATDEPGADHDLVTAILSLIEQSTSLRLANFAADLVDLLGERDLRDFLRVRFFDLHLSQYSRSRRRAPLYWQLSLPTGSYAVWVYYHSLTRDTLYKIQKEYAEPKLAYEQRKLDASWAELGTNPKNAERKALATQESFVEELRNFLDEVKRVAPLWNPDLDDGVIINFAPLWRLVPHHKPWQKELKATWEALCAGEYDWAHLAMHLWPERIIPKCSSDRSLAIAHGLEDIFWIEGQDAKWKPRPIPAQPVEDLVRERTSPAVKAALKSLLEAPVAVGSGGRRSRKANTNA